MTAISSDHDHTQADHTRPAAAPAARSARASSKTRHPEIENPAELEQAIETAVQKIQTAKNNQAPCIKLWTAHGHAVQAGQVQLEKSETTRLYGSRFVEQVADRCAVHHRRLHLCAQLVTMFDGLQLTKLAAAALPWRVLRDAVAYVGGGERRDQRMESLMERIPNDNASAARSAFAKWLKKECLKRNPLTSAHCRVIVDAGGQINSKVMTEERARALAHGRRIMEVKPAVK